MPVLRKPQKTLIGEDTRVRQVMPVQTYLFYPQKPHEKSLADHYIIFMRIQNAQFIIWYKLA